MQLLTLVVIGKKKLAIVKKNLLKQAVDAAV